jgi:translation elongation factor IF5A
MDSTTYVTNEPTCSMTISKLPSDMNIGDFIVLQNKPCKIVHIAVCKTGKHGKAKYHFTGLDIFTQRKYEELFMCHQTVQVPIVARVPMKLLYVNTDRYVQLQNDKDLTIREDLVLPEEYQDKISTLIKSDKEIFLVVQQAMGMEAIIEYKVKN